MNYIVNCNRAGDAEPVSSGMETAHDLAQCWEDGARARSLMVAILTAERIADFYKGNKHLAYFADDVSSHAYELELNLYRLRRELLGECLSDDDDDYAFDALDDSAPTVENALDRARKGGLVPPFTDPSAGLPCLGAARRGVDL